MILTVTLSPAIDKTAECESFNPSEVNRITPISVDFGGKGINVSRAAKKLGLNTYAIGIGFDKADEINRFLKSEGIRADFIKCPAPLRTNLKIFDNETKNTVEINEPASKVKKDVLSKLIQRFEGIVVNCDILVLAGSVPSGVPLDIYKTLCLRAKELNPEVKVIIDANGEALRSGIEAAPYMIKPNLEELCGAFGCALKKYSDIKAVAEQIIDGAGVNTVLISLGAQGAMIVDKERAYHQDAVKVDVKSAQGAGDAMVAGACLALEDGVSLYKTLVFGVCSAAGAVSQNGTAFCDRDFFDEKVKEILKK